MNRSTTSVLAAFAAIFSMSAQDRIDILRASGGATGSDDRRGGIQITWTDDFEKKA